MAVVLIPLAEGAEELEAVTIIDLLRRANIEVVVAGLQPGPVRCSRGTVIAPDMTLDEALKREYDMLVLPGGQPGASHLEEDPRVIALVKQMAGAQRYTAAICAAPRVLAVAGVLDGRRATGFPGTLDPVRFPHVRIEEKPVVADGRVITSRGPGTAMDFALSLIDLLASREQRERVQTGLQRPATHHLN